MINNLTVFSGNANIPLAQKVTNVLGIELGDMMVSRFADGEINIKLNENVRGKDVFIIQPTCAPPNRNLMELLLMMDAIHRASASRITAVVPYLGYARQDRRVRSSRVPISARVIADVMVSVGINRVLTIDLHAEQIQGFFGVPVDNIYCAPLFIQDICEQHYDNIVIVSPDVGGVMRARAVAKHLNKDLVIVDKRRQAHNEVETMNVIGDVHNKTCIIIDDIVDTAGTLGLGAKTLKEKGAAKVFAYCTHAVLSGDAIKNIESSVLDELIVADTIPLYEQARKCGKIRQLTVAYLLAEALRRVSNEESISVLFDHFGAGAQPLLPLNIEKYQ